MIVDFDVDALLKIMKICRAIYMTTMLYSICLMS